MTTNTNEVLLSGMLEIAVPLWVEKVKTRRDFDSWILDRGKILSQIIAETGDVILYRSKKKGQSAAAFNALAESLALCSFFPGGIKLFGCHWENPWPGTKAGLAEMWNHGRNEIRQSFGQLWKTARFSDRWKKVKTGLDQLN